MQETLRRWSFMGLLLVLVASLAWAGDGAPASTPPPITIIPQDGFNLVVDEQIDSHYVVVKLASPAHNWFAGNFTNLPTDKELTIGLSMAGNDTKGNEGNVKKWEGLRPVFTYADPAKYDTYEWFQKDAQGRWISGDSFKRGEAKYAGTGTIPNQTVIPKEVAKEFLSADGKYWQAWREIDKVDVKTEINILRCTQRFTRPSATIAMRIPFTYTYQEQYVARLQAQRIPGVFIDVIGATPGKRKLQVIRVEDTTSINTPEKIKTIIVIAREHATEHTSSWALLGMLSRLLLIDSERTNMRKGATWLFIPIQDPDGSANSTFDYMTEWMCHAWDPKIPCELFDYARYLTNYVNKGKSIDISISLHNVEANECPNIYCPFVDSRYQQMTNDINACIYTAMKEKSFNIPSSQQMPEQGWMNFRLYGWCALVFGAFDLAYEVNDRYPEYRLSNANVQMIGSVLTEQIGVWLSSEKGEKWHHQVHAFLVQRSKKRTEHFKEYGVTDSTRNQVDFLVLGY